MARDYAKVSPQFWTGQTGRQIRSSGQGTVVAAMYLLTSPHANMIGLYYQPIPTLCHETGLSTEEAEAALDALAALDFARYDPVQEVVWVPEMARHQIGETLKASDKRVKAIEKEAAKYRKCRFYPAFVEHYSEIYSLTLPDPEGSPFEAPSKPLRSQKKEQEQDQEQKQEQERTAANDAAHRSPPARVVPLDASPFVRWLSETYPDIKRPSEFEKTCLEAYPAVDLFAAARKARAWEVANPAHRKKAHGRFLNTWFARDQDKGHRPGIVVPSGVSFAT
jgi:hypothetical protein